MHLAEGIGRGDIIALTIGIPALLASVFLWNPPVPSGISAKVRYGIAVGAALIGIVGAGYVVFTFDEVDNSAIVLDRPQDGTIPYCTSFSGSAPKEEGYEVWIAYRFERNSEYFLLRVFRRTDNPALWSTARGPVGGKDASAVGNVYRIYAFYLQRSWGDYLTKYQARAASGGAYVFASQLPPGVPDDPKTSVARNTDLTPC